MATPGSTEMARSQRALDAVLSAGVAMEAMDASPCRQSQSSQWPINAVGEKRMPTRSTSISRSVRSRPMAAPAAVLRPPQKAKDHDTAVHVAQDSLVLPTTGAGSGQQASVNSTSSLESKPGLAARRGSRPRREKGTCATPESSQSGPAHSSTAQGSTASDGLGALRSLGGSTACVLSPPAVITRKRKAPEAVANTGKRKPTLPVLAEPLATATLNIACAPKRRKSAPASIVSQAYVLILARCSLSLCLFAPQALCFVLPCPALPCARSDCKCNLFLVQLSGVELCRTSTGSKTLPLQLPGGLSVVNLGRIEYLHPHFHTVDAIFPVGFEVCPSSVLVRCRKSGL